MIAVVSMLVIALSIWLMRRALVFWSTAWHYSFFSAGLILYVGAPCIYAQATGGAFDLPGIGVYRVDDEFLLATTLNCAAGIIAFAVGLRIGMYNYQSKISSSDLAIPTPTASNASVKTYYMVLFGSLVVILFNMESLLSSTSSYMGNIESTYRNPIYSFAKTLLFICIAISPVKSLYAFTVLQIGLVLFGVLSSDKDPMLLAGLGLAYRYIFAKGIKLKWYLPVVICMGLLAAAMLIAPLVSAYRYYRDVNQVVTEYEFNGARLFESDIRGPLATYIDSWNNQKSSTATTYVDVVFILVPRSIWPSRPHDVAEKYAMDKFGGEYIGGMGFGYSPMAEAIDNFGVFFSFIHFLILGISISVVWRLQKVLTMDGIHQRSFAFVFGGYIMLIACRTPISGVIKSSIFIFAAFSIASLAYHVFSRTRNIDNVKK